MGHEEQQREISHTIQSVVDQKVDEIKEARESGRSTSILVPDPRAYQYYQGSNLDSIFGSEICNFWKTLPEPNPDTVSGQIRQFVIENSLDVDQIVYEIRTGIRNYLGQNPSAPKEKYFRPNRYGGGTHDFYLTTLKDTVFHMFGWIYEGAGGQILLVTTNIPFEELTQRAKKIYSK